MSYDIIGDIHGHSETLKALLRKLGYRKVEGVYRHPSRRAVFVGDFIDRGPGQRDVIEIVGPMIDSGSALAVMGNHEFNAIAFATPRRDRIGHLREHNDKNHSQHREFLEAYRFESTDYLDVIEWFWSLPLWLDLGDLRVVHACWDPVSISYLRERLGPGALLREEVLVEACTKECAAYEAAETILKGKEVRLPAGASFRDKDGNERHEVRVRWWDVDAVSFRDAFFGPPDALAHIPEDPIGVDHLIGYGHDEPPVFLGHYWLQGDPVPLARNIACLDYSVAKPGGKLVAYRWDGEAAVDSRKFVAVEATDRPRDFSQ